jgi:hypothetical protein
MKLLFLSVCGKLDEPEETNYINLYLASLKKNVIPFFEIKVILLTTYKIENIESSLLKKRIDEYELSDIVELKTIYDLELPEKSLEVVNTMDWFSRIGVHMNILYDYSKRHSFFSADWIFHVDTDCEFLENFEKSISNINLLRIIHPRVIITLSGDSYPMNITHGDTEYVFTQPKRINFYDDENVTRPSTQVVIQEKMMREEDHRRNYKSSVIFPYQMKVRNDFVGISKEMVYSADFNWVFMHYDYKFKDNGPIQTFWPDKAFKQNADGLLYEIPMPEIHVNFHMGGMLQYTVHSGELDVIRIQLPSYTHAVQHYSSGWFNGNFIERSLETLNSKYQETKEIWNADYE